MRREEEWGRGAEEEKRKGGRGRKENVIKAQSFQ